MDPAMTPRAPWRSASHPAAGADNPMVTSISDTASAIDPRPVWNASANGLANTPNVYTRSGAMPNACPTNATATIVHPRNTRGVPALGAVVTART